MKYIFIGLLALATLWTASAQVDPCVSAGDCEQQAFAFAFTDDAEVGDVSVADAERIQADVRQCFQPCAESARKIAKLSIAAGANLFDERKDKSGRGRGRINKPTFGKDNAPGQQNKGDSGNNGNRGNNGNNGNRGNSDNARGASNAGRSRAELLANFNRGGGRGKRAANTDPAQCVNGILGMSQYSYMQQCRAQQGVARNPDVKKLLEDAGVRVTPAPNNPLGFLDQIRNSFGSTNAGSNQSPTSLLSNFGQLGRGGLGSNLGNLFGGGRGKRAAGGKFKSQKDKQGELLYMFAYAKQIAERVCPDQREKVMFCVQKASMNTIDFDNVDVEKVKSRYCDAKTQCQQRKTACEQQLGEAQAQQCVCLNEIKAKVGRRCELPPSPCDQQNDAPRLDTTGDLCQSETPSADDVIEMVRSKHGGGRAKIAAAKAKNNRRG